MATQAERDRKRRREQVEDTPRPEMRANLPAEAGTRAGASVKNFFRGIGRGVSNAVTRRGEGELATVRAVEAGRQSASQFASGAVSGFQDPRLAESLPDRAPRPPQSPQVEAGQSDTNNGTPGSEVVGSPDPLSTVVPGGGSEDATTPVSLSQIGADSTREIPRPPQTPGADLPEGSVRIHMGGRGVFIQDPSGLRFRELPGKTVEQSREAAANSNQGEQFRQQQIISQQNADANTVSADAQASRAQVESRVTVVNDDNTLSIRERDASGQLVDLGVEPHIQDIVDGTDVFEYKTIETGTGEQLIQFNETQGTQQNITKEEANKIAVAQFNRLVNDGEDPEDAAEEVEKTFGIGSLNIQ